MSDFWLANAHLIGQLKAHVEAGLSTSQIAKALSLDNGLTITRNMVHGKATRLGLILKFKRDVKDKPKKLGVFLMPLSAAVRTKSTSTPPKPIPEDDGTLLPLTDEAGKPITVENARRHHCRYPYGDVGKDFRYCGRDAIGSSFCEAHRKICFSKSYMDPEAA